MEGITVIDVQSAVAVFVAVLSIIAVSWGGVKAIREALSPLTNSIKASEKTNETVEKHETRLADIEAKQKDYDDYFRKDKRELEKDREELDDLKKANSLVLRGINQLIEHELTGNHDVELKQTQKDITEYLINR